MRESGSMVGRCGTVLTASLMGARAGEVSVRYKVASPAGRRMAVPMAIVHGSEDPIVSAYQAGAVPGARRFPVAGAGHFDLIHPQTAACPVLLQALSVVTQ